ncbi:MAG: lysine--tRNA ligase [Phototrophicales bacterium]|nr:MAG: lysine--tRNA ligase [Phototrophicales bacterium]
MTWQPNNPVEQDRFDKYRRLVEAGISPFPPRVQRTHTAQQAIELYEQAEAQSVDSANEIQVTVVGRIVRQNVKGKIYFGHIEDGSGRIQLMIRVNDIDQEFFELLKQNLDLGDFVQASGTMMRTKAGEVSVRVNDLVILAKALKPLPVIKERVREDGTVERFGAFSDVEERYRQRYADLAVNPDVREIFRIRAKVIRALQNFLDDQGFLEVETPILQPVYGGAAARPFTTYHNQLKQELYLRISFELYLKRLLVGGYEGVYEIGRDFRNEGVSYKHNPEFTMMEVYQAYTDYYGMMTLAENLMRTICLAVKGTTKLTFKGNEIDFGPPFARYTMRELIREHTGIDYAEYPTAEALESAIREKGIDVRPNLNRGKLIEHLLEEVEPTLIQPTFVMDYPIEISPLAKKKEDDPTHVERFEFYVGGMEFGNAFTELNDPFDQEARFIELSRLYREDEDDANPIDEDYLNAMRYGMPPCGGLGIGVDRLVMLMTDRHTIREVLLFPHLRTRDDSR